MTKKPDPELSELTAHMPTSADVKGRRSSLFRWMFRRASEFQKTLDETQASWSAIADAASSLGLRDGAGKLPTAERVRKTWFEVRRLKGWTGRHKPAPETKPAPVPAPVPEREASSFLTDADEPPTRTFKPATLRNHMPSASPPTPPPAAPKPQDPPDLDRADQIIAAMLSGAPKNPFRKSDED